MQGEKYKGSGKVKLGAYIPSFLIGLVLSILIGMGYGLAAHHNPLIYVNFLILAAAIVLLFLVCMGVWSIGGSRNRFVNFAGSLVIGFMGITGAWFALMRGTGWLDVFSVGEVWDFAFNFADRAHYCVSKFGRSGVDFDGGLLFFIYLIEFLAFLVPAFLALFSLDVYCEACDTSAKTLEYYAVYDKEVKSQLKNVSDGDYRKVFENMQLIQGMHGHPGTVLFQVRDHVCAKCKDFRVLDVNEGLISQDEKGNKEFKNKEIIVSSVISAFDSKIVS